MWLCQASGNDSLNELLLEVGLAVQSPNSPRTKKGPLAAIDCHYSFILSFFHSFAIVFCTRWLELDIVIALCYQLNVKNTNGCEDHQLRQADERSVGG